MKNMYGCLFIVLISVFVQADNNESISQDTYIIMNMHQIDQLVTEKKYDFALEGRQEEYGFDEDLCAEYEESGMCSKPSKPLFLKDYFYSMLGDVIIFLIPIKSKIDEYIEQLKKFVTKWLSLKSTGLAK